MRRASGFSVLSKYMLEHFGNKFRQWLNERNATLADIARALKMNYTNLYSFGAPPPLGRMPSPDTAVEIADYLGVSRDEFFSSMGQIDPSLLELVTPDIVEEAFMQMHQFLRSVQTKEDVRTNTSKDRKLSKLMEKIASNCDEQDISLLAQFVDWLVKVKQQSASQP